MICCHHSPLRFAAVCRCQSLRALFWLFHGIDAHSPFRWFGWFILYTFAHVKLVCSQDVWHVFCRFWMQKRNACGSSREMLLTGRPTRPGSSSRKTLRYTPSNTSPADCLSTQAPLSRHQSLCVLKHPPTIFCRALHHRGSAALFGFSMEMRDLAKSMAGGGAQDQLWAEAAEAAAERRGRSAGVSAQEQWEGVLTWEHPPVAGATATVLYNKDSGALRCILTSGYWRPNDCPPKTVEILSPFVHGQA